MRLTPTYLDGVILATNAIRGTRLLIDAHRCVLERCWARDATHDWRGHLSGSGPFARDRRVFAPNWHGYKMATGTEETFADYLRLIASRYPGEPILVARGQMSLLTNTDAEGVSLEASAELGVPVLCVRREGFDDDWVDGIRETFEVLWNHMLREGGDASPVVAGYCLFRHEGDESGNVAELRRLLAAGGAPALRWPFTGGDDGFGAVDPSAPRVVFPFVSERGAAAVGDQLTRVELPMGIAGTSRFLRSIGELFRCGEGSDVVIARECARIRDNLEPFVSRMLAGRAALVVADPWTADGLCATLRELGMDVPGAAVLRRSDRDPVVASIRANAGEVFIDPDYAGVETWLRERVERRECDVVVGAAVIRDAAARVGIPYVEVTAPHYLEHFALPAPYMGFEGMMKLAERLSKAVAEHEYLRGFRGKG